MKPLRATNSKSLSTPRRGRRGAVVGLFLVALIFVSGFMALGVNIVRLRQIQTQLRGVCRSAALAGAAQLLNERTLYRAPGAVDENNVARLAACAYAQANFVDGYRVKLDPNASNQPTGDLVLGWIDPAGPVNQPIVLSTAEAPHDVNTVRVTGLLSRNVANRVSLWFGNFVGMTTADVAVAAQASLDQRILGFRAEPGVKVPVAPLIAEYGPWMKQATAAIDPQTNDLYAVDPLTGIVTAGADGIPEILLTSESASAVATEGAADASSTTAAATAGRFTALQLWNEENLSYIGSVRAREGLSLSDLRDYGGALIVQNGATAVGVEPMPSNDLPYGLMDVIGQVRAWPLGEPNAAGLSSWNMIGFGAGRIVAIRRIDGGTAPTWNFVIQPATLVSSQAVAGIDGASNPWIAKLELTQ